MLKVRSISSCGTLPELPQVLEERQHAASEPSLDLGGDALGQDAGQIFGDAAAGDVRHAATTPARDELLDDVQVAAVGLHQRGAGLFLDER